MPQPTKIPRAFASSGDKNTIPDSTGSIGLASWVEGFPAITSTPFAQGGVAPKRADFNGVFNALSAATVWQQKGGFYAYDATTDYEIGNVVEYNGELYKCLVANGPSSTLKDPTQTTYWARLYTSAGGSVTGHFIVDGYHNSISNYGMLLTGTNQNYGFTLQDTTITKGSVFPASTKYISQIYYGSAMGTYNDRMAHIREAIDNNGANRLEIVAFGLQSANDTTTCTITVGVDENDVPYTSAPTPSTGDNSTKIATTEFVNGFALPLTGGTLTGDLTMSQMLSFTSSNPVINSGGADHYLRLGNGDSSTLYANGASLYLYGSSTTGETLGGFNLQTYDGSNRATLSGRPDGTLTWKSKDIAIVDSANATNSGHIRFTNGVQILWGNINIPSASASTGYAVTFEKAFSSTPRIFMGTAFNSNYGYAFGPQATNRTTTGFTAFIGSSQNGTTERYASGNCNYLAIGPWA